MKLLSRISLLFAVALFIGAGSAKADSILYFSLTGPVSATFELPTHPTVSVADYRLGFLTTPINLTVDGVAAPDDFIAFYRGGPDGGAFAIFSSTIQDVVSLAGIQLFTGSPHHPRVFAARRPIVLSDFYSDTEDRAYTLTISKNAPKVSEPSTMLLLAAGLLPLGLLAKRLL
ncbi:MAG TPA: hypothetical protein VE545_00970 [Candidatus Dormibacteraeota bacterium]|nr:hypothetical protein [Candidatus Dormibacteraeota bacterium]